MEGNLIKSRFKNGFYSLKKMNFEGTVGFCLFDDVRESMRLITKSYMEL